MSSKDTQKIIVLIKGNAFNDGVVNGVFFSNLLKKDLCLYTNYSNEKERIKNQALLKKIEGVVENQLQNIKIHTRVLKGRLSKHISQLVEDDDGVLFISAHHSLPLIRAFHRSSIPFLFVNSDKGVLEKYEHVAVPVDFRSNTKDAALWASYLGRFNDSEVNLIVADDKWKELKDKTQKVLRFIRNFYSQFDFDYFVHDTDVSSIKVQNHAVKMVESLHLDMIIASGSNSLTTIDYLLGSSERRLLKQVKQTTTMLINPRKELTILCR